jgi:hypothetical protein
VCRETHCLARAAAQNATDERGEWNDDSDDPQGPGACHRRWTSPHAATSRRNTSCPARPADTRASAWGRRRSPPVASPTALG